MPFALRPSLFAALVLAAQVGTGRSLPQAMAGDPPEPDPAAAAAAAAPSIVRVAWDLKTDQGQDPPGGNARLIAEERPLESSGFVLSPTRVVTADPNLHPRFVRGVTVHAGGRSVPAKIAAYATGQAAVLLDLAEPLPGAKPLAFNAKLPAPYQVVSYGVNDGEWLVQADGFPGTLLVDAGGRRLRAITEEALVVDARGGPVGVVMNGEVSDGDDWKGSPADWPAVSAGDLVKRLAALQTAADRALLRVTLTFRSPRSKTGRSRWNSPGGEEEGNVHNVPGVLLDGTTLLVLAELNSDMTARLEKIAANPPEGKPVPAAFARSLRDYGALVATLERPLDGAVKVSTEPLVAYRTAMMLGAEVRVQGERRVVYTDRARIRGFEIGYRGLALPTLTGDDEMQYVFDASGALAALPASVRDKDAERRRSHGDARLLPAAVLAAAVKDPAAADPGNVPLSEAEENRLAWLGVELQPLNKELARANGVAHLTNDGENGALVTYLYPGGPAEKAGLAAGDLLLRLHVPERPKPIEVKLEEDMFGMQNFPWDKLDQIPEEYFDQIPTPWPAAENALTRALTDLGFGKKFAAEIVRGGETRTVEFETVQGPAHYDAAPRFVSKPLGLTVRDLTYEVRRYFQKKPDDPGVIVSKVEPGGKAAVAGVKPYETITHVNDAPVTGIAEFEKLTTGQEEMRFSVSHLTRSRIVKVRAGGPEKEKAPKEGGDPPK